MLSEKHRAKNKKDDVAIWKQGDKGGEGNCIYHADAVDPLPPCASVASPRIHGRPVCEMRRFFKKMQGGCEREEPNCLTKG